MEEPILVFKQKSYSSIVVFAAWVVIILSSVIAGIKEQGFSDYFNFSLSVQSFIIPGVIIIFIVFNIVKKKKTRLYVYHDHLTDKRLTREDEIYFEEFQSIRFQEDCFTSKDSDGHTTTKTKHFLIFEDEHKEENDRVDFLFFTTKGNLEKFISFIKENYPHVSFDSNIQNMLQGTMKFPRTVSYTTVIILTLFCTLWSYGILHSW